MQKHNGLGLTRQRLIRYRHSFGSQQMALVAIVYHGNPCVTTSWHDLTLHSNIGPCQTLTWETRLPVSALVAPSTCQYHSDVKTKEFSVRMVRSQDLTCDVDCRVSWRPFWEASLHPLKLATSPQNKNLEKSPPKTTSSPQKTKNPPENPGLSKF